MEAILGVGLGYVAVLMPVIIVFVALYFGYLKSKKKYDALIELSKNSSDPSQIDKIIKSLEDKAVSPITKRNGVVVLFAGIGLYLFGWVAFGWAKVGYIIEGAGLLLAAIGIGIMIAAYLLPSEKEKS